MPLYEYICNECDARFEKLVSASKRDDVECDFCGAKKAQRQISTFAARITGTAVSASSAPRFT